MSGAVDGRQPDGRRVLQCSLDAKMYDLTLVATPMPSLGVWRP